MTKASPKANEAQVKNHGDVTERDAALAPAEMIEVQPLAELPDGYKSLAKAHANAKGFTTEASGAVAVHY